LRRGSPQSIATVQEISAAGARLEVAAGAQLPDTFLLAPDDGNASAYRCCLTWRDDTSVGIKFD